MTPIPSPTTTKTGRSAKARLLALAAGVLALLVLIAACESSPTPTSTPTPTPTPTPAPDPIVNLSASATYADLAALLPQAAVECLVGALGQAAYDSLLTHKVFGDEIDLSGDLPLDCFSEEVVLSVFIATLAQAAGGLSDATVTCIRNTFEGLGVAQLATLASGDLGGGEGLEDVFGIAVGLLLCLSDDEAKRTTAGGLFGDVDGFEDISLADIRCIFESVDLSELMALISSIDGGAAPDLGSGLGTGLELLTALNDCGLSMDVLLGAGEDAMMDDGAMMDETPPVVPGLGDIDLATIDLRNIEGIPPELQAQITCAVDAMGEENLAGLVAGTYTPTLDDFLAISGCNIDLAQLSDMGAIIGQ